MGCGSGQYRLSQLPIKCGLVTAKMTAKLADHMDVRARSRTTDASDRSSADVSGRLWTPALQSSELFGVVRRRSYKFDIVRLRPPGRP
jgi:hypothetical protein